MFEVVAGKVSGRVWLARMRGSLLTCWEEESEVCLRLLEVSEFMILEFIWPDSSKEVGIAVIEVAASEELGGNGEETVMSEWLVWMAVMEGLEPEDEALAWLLGLCTIACDWRLQEKTEGPE